MPFDFSRTFQHSLNHRGVVELLPTVWLLGLANPYPSELTDLGYGQGEAVDMATLWEDLVTQGMRDPLIITAGRRDRRCRLEAGNHRIRLFAKHGVLEVPATVLVGETCVYNKGNGLHGFSRELRVPQQWESLAPYSECGYASPSDVFTELHALPES